MLLRKPKKRSLDTIEYAVNNRKKNSLVITTGCLPKINNACLPVYENLIIVEFAEFSKLDSIISARKKFTTIPDAGTISSIPDLHRKPSLKRYFKYLPLSKNRIQNLFFSSKNFIRNAMNSPVPSLPFMDNDIYNVMIARGCLGKCSFCAIRLSHGKIKSKPLGEILDLFRDGLQNGYKNFVLIAEDSGAYGLDLGSTYPELLKNIFELNSDFKLVLNDINPQWLIRYFDKLLPIFEKYQDRIPYIILPVQSGSNDILKKMRRPYKIEKVQDCFDRLYQTVPSIKIKTHALIGFPGETYDDFIKTKNFLKRYNLLETTIYEYENRVCCESAKLPSQISAKEKNRRINILRNELTHTVHASMFNN